MRQILGETVSAQIATVPIIVFSFGVLSNVAVIANLLVLPLVPLAMLLTFIAGLGSIITPGLADVIATPAEWLLTYMTTVVQYFASLPWAQTIMEIPSWIVWVAYGVIIAICLYLWRATKYNLADSNIVK